MVVAEIVVVVVVVAVTAVAAAADTVVVDEAVGFVIELVLEVIVVEVKVKFVVVIQVLQEQVEREEVESAFVALVHPAAVVDSSMDFAQQVCSSRTNQVISRRIKGHGG